LQPFIRGFLLFKRGKLEVAADAADELDV